MVSRPTGDSRNIWELLENEARLQKTEQDIVPLDISENPPVSFCDDEEKPKPLDYQRARMFCFPDFLYKRPFETDRGIALKDKGHNPGVVFDVCPEGVNNSEYKETYLGRPEWQDQSKSHRKWLEETMTRYVEENYCPPVEHCDTKENYFLYLRNRSKFLHRNFTSCKRVSLCEKGHRSTAVKYPNNTADKEFKCLSESISRLREDADRCARLSLAELTTGSDIRNQLNPVHSAILTHRHGGLESRLCENNCITTKKAAKRSTHFTIPVAHHKNIPAKFDTYH